MEYWVKSYLNLYPITFLLDVGLISHLFFFTKLMNSYPSWTRIFTLTGCETCILTKFHLGSYTVESKQSLSHHARWIVHQVTFVEPKQYLSHHACKTDCAPTPNHFRSLNGAARWSSLLLFRLARQAIFLSLLPSLFCFLYWPARQIPAHLLVELNRCIIIHQVELKAQQTMRTDTTCYEFGQGPTREVCTKTDWLIRMKLNLTQKGNPNGVLSPITSLLNVGLISHLFPFYQTHQLIS